MWVVSNADERRIMVGHMSENGTAALKHPDAASLHEMWSVLRGPRPAPFRAELDAERIGAKAPFLAIFEHVGPSNFRVRIAGDRLNRWFGMELRGMSVLAMVEGPARNHMQAALNRVVADPSVGVVRGRARALDGRSQAFEMVLLPMRSDFGRIDRVLAGVWMLDSHGSVAAPFLLDADEIHVCPIDAGEGPVTLTDRPSDPGFGESPTPQIAPDADLPGADLPGPAAPSARGVRGHLRLVKNS